MSDLTNPATALSKGLNRARRSNWRRYGLLALGGSLVCLVLLLALFADFVSPYSPYDLDVASMLQGPSSTHWLGTDEVGRDVLSRAIFAARISVEVALVAVSVGLIGGTIVGILSAYFGGLVDLARRPPTAELPPPKLLGVFEPVLLGWVSREPLLGSDPARIVAGGLFRAFALADGRAVATWSLDEGKLVLQPFGRLSREVRAALAHDGDDLIRYLGAVSQPAHRNG